MKHETANKIVRELLPEWLSLNFVEGTVFKKYIYNFYKVNKIPDYLQLNLKQISDFLEVYCEEKNIAFVRLHIQRIHGVQTSGKLFIENKKKLLKNLKTKSYVNGVERTEKMES